jgi:lysophospholipase L1-like esterase
MPLNDPVPSAAFDVLERNVQDADRFVNGTAVFVNRIGDSIEPISIIRDTVGAIGGIRVFETYALLDAHTPTTPEQTTSFKVTNDSTPSLNGYYSWVSGTTYTKDADLVLNTFDSLNTSESISAFAIEQGINRARTTVVSNNLFNLNLRTDGKFVSSNGSIGNNAGLSVSPYIHATASTSYYCSSINGSSMIAYSYDENLQPLGTGHTTTTFTTESGTAYIAFTIGLGEIDEHLNLASDGTEFSEYIEELEDVVDIEASMGDFLNSADESVGQWVPFNGSTVAFNTSQIDITTTAGNFRGAKNDKILTIGADYYIEFEAKISAGSAQDWYLTNTNIGTSQELITGLSGEWKRYYINISTITGSNKNFLFYQSVDEAGNTLSIRNLWYYNTNSMLKNTASQISELFNLDDATQILIADLFALDLVLPTAAMDEVQCANFAIGGWTGSQGAGSAAFNTDRIEITTAASSYSGIKNVVNLTEGGDYYIEFEARVSAGNLQDWYLTNSSIGTAQELITGLTSEYQRFYINVQSPTAGNKNFTFYQSVIEAGNVLDVKNFWYYTRDSWFKSASNADDKNQIATRKKVGVNNTTGSVDSYLLENEISDLLRPDRKGKIEFKDTDLVPSINNMGTGYLFDNGGTIELRVVKDATEVVGIALANKVTSTITPVSFSIAYFGDSITFGVGASPKYTDQTDTLLTSDGHTLTTSTNNGVSGYDALQLKGYVDGLTPVAHDVAVLMIGINDIEHWIDYSEYPGTVSNIEPALFRVWYKENLDNLIASIATYCSYTTLFLVVPTPQRITLPSSPSADRVAANPLMQVVIQECIEQYSSDSTIQLCRGDYYLKDPTSGDIPDGIHPSTAGAGKLAKGVRDEITFRV